MEPAAPMALEETSLYSTTAAVSLEPNRTADGYAQHSSSFSHFYLTNPPSFLPVDFLPTNN